MLRVFLSMSDKDLEMVGSVEEVLLAKDRTVAAATAQPYGLYLVGVTYPASFQLPTSEPGPYFLAPPN